MPIPKSKEHRYAAEVIWTGAGEGPTRDYKSYSRTYRVALPGKAPFDGSSDSAFLGDAALINPEEMLLVALSSCHMLSFLALAGLEGYEVVAYRDAPHGTMLQEGRGGRFTEVVLRPEVEVAPDMDPARAEALHEAAHKTCFIANSVNFPVRHEARVKVSAG